MLHLHVLTFTLFLTLFVVHPSSAFNFHKIVRQQSKAAINVDVAKLIIGGALVLSPLMVQADDLDGGGYTAVPVQLTNREARTEVPPNSREVKAVVIKNGNSNGKGEEDLTYLGKLKKEQAKQEGRKKSKTERAKDLCETLGRGC